MTFPRIAIHTGNSVVFTNKHPEWKGTIVIQHNETTATLLKHGSAMKKSTKKLHPMLSTFQSTCQAPHWKEYSSEIDGFTLFGEEIKNGQFVVKTDMVEAVGVEPIIAR